MVNAANRIDCIYTGTAYYTKGSATKELAALQIYDTNGYSFLLGGRDSGTTDTTSVAYTDEPITLPAGSYYVYVNWKDSQANGGSLSMDLGE